MTTIKIAIASLQETRALMFEACDRGYIGEKERDEGLKLALRAIAASTRLRQYLIASPTPVLAQKKVAAP